MRTWPPTAHCLGQAERVGTGRAGWPATSEDHPGIGGGAAPRLSLGVSHELPLKRPFSLQT